MSVNLTHATAYNVYKRDCSWPHFGRVGHDAGNRPTFPCGLMLLFFFARATKRSAEWHGVLCLRQVPATGKSYPLDRPTTSSLSSHSWPGAYRPRSSTLLLSPLVKNFTLPSSLSTHTSTHTHTGREGGKEEGERERGGGGERGPWCERNNLASQTIVCIYTRCTVLQA